MTKNPLLNAFGALGYISLVTILMNYVTQTQSDKPDTSFAPVIFLSVLTLSVAVMAYIFFFQPVQLLIDGKKKQAIKLFGQTVGVFAVITLLSLILLFSGLI